MLRILHVMGCSDVGGISSVVRNFAEFMDWSQIHFDIALTVPEEGQNSRALEAMGAKIYHIPLKSEDPEGFRRELTELLQKGNYDGIHVHESETSYVALRIAKKLGIPCRIAHSHTSSPYEGLRSIPRRWSGCLLNYHYATHVIACGQLSGDRVFGKWNMRRSRAVVLPNAVDSRRFAYDPVVRQEMRSALGAEDRLILGMASRLSPEKNIPFALELTAELRKTIPEVLLLVAGNGEEEPMLQEKIREQNLRDHVHFLGRRADMDRLFQAFDIFLLPSLHEGFPVAAVEAMASGLPVLLSDTVTRELDFGSGVRYLSLQKMPDWVSAVLSFRQDTGRETRQQEIEDNDLDIRASARKLAEIYRQDAAASR